MATFILADDNVYMQNCLKLILKKNNHEIVGTATNGRDAVKIYKELKPDIIILDITMPQLNGIEALKQIIEFDAKANVIMASAHQQNQVVFMALEAGAKDYIKKPISPENIMKVVNKVLNIDE